MQDLFSATYYYVKKKLNLCKKHYHKTVTPSTTPDPRTTVFVEALKVFLPEETRKTADYRERLKFDIFKKQVRILVITPDRLDKENTMTLLRVVRANNQRICVVIDEVHTIIEDCHFRPCFNKIALIKKNIPDTYHLAISATINDASCLLIQQKLDIPNAVKVLSPYVHRVNIEYKTVLRKSSLTSAVYAQIKDGLSSSRGIIYASSQKHVNGHRTFFLYIAKLIPFGT